MLKRTNYFFWLMFLFSSLPFAAQAQRETANWLFGKNAYLKFGADGKPVNVAGSAMNTPHGCAAMSDKQGNLLFYTNGEIVWNAQHQIMTNGSGLLGNRGARQSCIIIPNPGNSNKYYIITQEAFPNGLYANLCYSEVDMAAGLGAVVTATKNTRFFHVLGSAANVYLSEKLTATKHANGRDYWLLAHQYVIFQQEFLCFRITPTGILPPVKSRLPNTFFPHRDFKAPIKVSPDGKWIGIQVIDGNRILKFNAKTGLIVSFTSGGNQYTNKGIEFSPDSKKVYFSCDTYIEQYDLTISDPSFVGNSRKEIGRIYSTPNNLYGNLQLAPNGRIYIARIGLNFLSEIANPNKAGKHCNLRLGPQLMPGTLSRTGLPNFISSYFTPPEFTFMNACAGSPITFTISDTAYLDSVRWNFGNAASGPANTSSAWQPSHIYNAAGTYEATLYTYVGGVVTAYKREVHIIKPIANLGHDTLLCSTSQITLRNAATRMPYEHYKWNTGDTTEIINVSQPGIYKLTVSNPFCATTDSVEITFGIKPALQLGNDTLICSGAGLMLQNRLFNAGNLTYRWSTGQATPTIYVTKPGAYKLEISNGVCTVQDEIIVTYVYCPENLFIPNIITRNNDGYNERLVIKGIETGTGRLQIYNRWGQHVYTSESYQNDWPQKPINCGVYFYILEEPDAGKVKGWLEVIE